MTEKTILLELRDAAKNSRDERYRDLVRRMADHMQCAIGLVWQSPTRSNMQDLNGLWVQAHNLLDNEPADDNPRGGQVRVESTEKVRVAA